MGILVMGKHITEKGRTTMMKPTTRIRNVGHPPYYPYSFALLKESWKVTVLPCTAAASFANIV